MKLRTVSVPRWTGPDALLLWVTGALGVAAALAVIVLVAFGTGERGTDIALQLTARWSFLFFWLAYVSGAVANLFGRPFQVLKYLGRELGLAFASAMLVHIGLILWLFHIPGEPSGSMALFWAGIVCTYLLAVLSLPRLRAAVGPRVWRALCVIAMEYIAFVFATDFILLRLDSDVVEKHPLAYLPFAIMLVGATCLRIIASLRRTAIFRKPPHNPISAASQRSRLGKFNRGLP